MKSSIYVQVLGMRRSSGRWENLSMELTVERFMDMESHVYLMVVAIGLASEVTSSVFHSDQGLSSLCLLTSVCDNDVSAVGWRFESLRHVSVAAPTRIS